MQEPAVEGSGEQQAGRAGREKLSGARDKQSCFTEDDRQSDHVYLTSDDEPVDRRLFRAVSVIDSVFLGFARGRFAADPDIPVTGLGRRVQGTGAQEQLAIFAGQRRN